MTDRNAPLTNTSELLADDAFVESVEVQTEYERGVFDGQARMRTLADDVLARALADELEIEALKARVEDLTRRLHPSPPSDVGGRSDMAMLADGLETVLRGWAKAYRDSPEHRFPSDPHAEFFPFDLEAAANEIVRLRQSAPSTGEQKLGSSKPLGPLYDGTTMDNQQLHGTTRRNQPVVTAGETATTPSPGQQDERGAIARIIDPGALDALGGWLSISRRGEALERADAILAILSRSPASGNGAMREALEPFAKVVFSDDSWEAHDLVTLDTSKVRFKEAGLTVGHFWKARDVIAALAAVEQASGGGVDAIWEAIKTDVAEQLAEGDGLWRACSGCHNTEDGYDVGRYPHSTVFGCKLGGGCSECGGIGAIWDTTDYAAMGEELAAELLATPAPAVALRETLELARQEIVLAIAFLGRDVGTDRLGKTIDGLTARLCAADQAILTALAQPEQESAPASVGVLRLGDMVRVNEKSPFFHDWRNTKDLKLVSLRIDPDGKQWASVIDGNQRHRGNGAYDGETDDFDADHLSPVATLSESRR